MDSKVQYNHNYIDKTIFLFLYQKIYTKIFDIKSTISNSFADTDLILFNSQYILDKFSIRFYIPTVMVMLVPVEWTLIQAFALTATPLNTV